MKKELKLTDILVTIVIAIAFGIVYILWGTVYYAVQPLGLHLDQLLYGMWFIAGTVAYFIIRKPGVALLAEIAAASGEFLLGSPWGLTVLLSGVVQGLFAELVFMAFRYKRFDLKVAALAASASCVGSLLVDALNEIGRASCRERSRSWLLGTWRFTCLPDSPARFSLPVCWPITWRKSWRIPA